MTAATAGSKAVSFYDSAPDLNDTQAFKDHLDWLAKRLMLRLP
jgi:hypothetical protein